MPKPSPNLLTHSSSFPFSPKVKYKSDLNLTRGIGWTPPGSYKVEMARRAAELANARGLALQGAYVSSKVQTRPACKATGKGKLTFPFSDFIFGQRSAGSKACEMQLEQGA